jgi:glyoxylase-like metal-dependent hydrolase (beta-lactamase superfamily II)/rhodanese-related sulfurtransferase
VEIYMDEAHARDLQITHILETHLHADFISGHMELADLTGAEICAPAAGNCAFPHRPVSESDTIEIEDMTLTVMETPGHTPEHVCFVVTDNSRGEDPVGVFTGDTLFVGDVGRPDLFPDLAEDLAGMLYESLHDRLMQLPDFCEVYPAHGAGSLCGRAVGAKRRTTIGYECRYNPALRIGDRDVFIRSLTTDMPPAPDHFSRCSDVNRQGPELIRNLPAMEALTPHEFQARMDAPGSQVLDIRSYDAFDSQHVPGSISIDFRGNFPTFCGWMMPPQVDILLVAVNRWEAVEAQTWARRVGVDRVTGFLRGEMSSWSMKGFDTARIEQVSASGLRELLVGNSPITLIDVRSRREFLHNGIEGALNIPAPDLRERHVELDRETTCVLVCSTGFRSSLGASILEAEGFRSIVNVSGGMSGYAAAGFSRECLMCISPHGSGGGIDLSPVADM